MAQKSLDELKKKRDILAARIRAEEAKQRTRTRRQDTRRKVLAGAAVLYHADQDSAFREQLMALLDGFLKRPDERAAFDLAETRANAPR